MKTQAAERERTETVISVGTEKVRMLQEELQNALRQIDELSVRMRELEAKVLPVGDGKRDTVHAKEKVAKCMVVGDSMLRNVGAEHI